MLVTGYTDWPSYDPGDSVPLHLSGDGEISIELVRLRHGDTNPDGPGLVYRKVPGIALTATARPRPLPRGSYMTAENLGLEDGEAARSFTAWVYLTRYPEHRATIFSASHSGGVSRLDVDATGRLAYSDGSAGWPPPPPNESGTVRLAARVWSLVALVIRPGPGIAEIAVYRSDDTGWRNHGQHASGRPILTAGASITFAAHVDGPAVSDAFDGKLEAPAFWPRPLTASELAALAAGQAPAGSLLRWDFSQSQQSLTAVEVCREAHGTLVNLPARAVTGHSWSGLEEDWRTAPRDYAAIHFHHDDLADARWPVTATLALPGDLDNGVYAAKLSAAGGETDFLPFTVRARAGSAASRPLAVLLPTFTYLAYANEAIFAPHVPLTRSDADDWAAEQGLLSQYNWHADGSGVIYASWLRPLLNLRPDYRYWLTGHPHGLSADLYLLDWLEREGIAFEVLTDHDLHRDGRELLGRYRAVVTGSHPEYWTRRNAEALTSYLDQGGRLVYAGGNGFGGYVGIHPELAQATEMRRLTSGFGLWDSEPGEARLASTGEMGGHGRHHQPRGRQITGVDITGMGFSRAVAFRRTDASYDPRAAFAFDGVEEKVIGGHGLHMGGAAGYEVDGADYASGTPAHALVVATADDFGAYVQTDSRIAPRADMVFFETPAGGAVFSFSSITWTGSLSGNSYNNCVSAITRNVLRRFLDPAPFSWPFREGHSAGSESRPVPQESRPGR